MLVRLFRCLVALSLVVGIFGCGGGGNPNAPANLSGKVTYKDAPVTGGVIGLHSKEAGLNTITIGADGSYNGVDLPAGEVTITIETESIKKKNEQYGGADKGQKMTSPVPQGAQGTTGVYVAIPKKYADKNTSGLTMTLQRGPNKKDFNLTD